MKEMKSENNQREISENNEISIKKAQSKMKMWRIEVINDETGGKQKSEASSSENNQ
jgi:hypothetical protein